MDTMTYRSIMERLDGQVAQAKKEAERKARREELDRKIALIDHWKEGLLQKKTELEKFGVAPEIDIDKEIAQLDDDRAALIANFSEAPAPMPDGRRIELDNLTTEIDETAFGEDASFDERWALYANWACRWRMIVDKVGQATVEREPAFARCFARIRERMNLEKERGPFIRALDPKAQEDWALKLSESEERLRKVGEEKKGQNVAEEALFSLMAVPKKYHLPDDPEGMRQLRHWVRTAARYPHVRDEVAQIVVPWQEHLKGEFGYLWAPSTSGFVLPTPDRKLSRKEICQRILRRMRMKGLIGASHGPYDRISTDGFPGHDLGRSRAAVDLLIRTSILRKKPTSIGSRISIEPKAVGAVDGFLKGDPMNITDVDAWCEDQD